MATQSTTSKKEGFLAKVDWKAYSKYRPPYPPSLEKLIIDYYQRTHDSSGEAEQHRLAHDVGSGAGIFATVLAKHFDHVHVSDPNPAFIAQARNWLEEWSEGQREEQSSQKRRFTFSVATAERADETAIRGSVDCMTLMQCAHWTDQDQMVAAAARSLAPQGTLAIVLVNCAPKVVGNEKIAAAVDDLFAFWGQSIYEWRGGAESTMAKQFLPQTNAGTKCIHLPEDTFIPESTERIEINVQGRGPTPHAIPGMENMIKPSRVGTTEKLLEYTSDDPKGLGWRYEVEADYFAGVVKTMESEDRWGLYFEKFQEVENIIRAESPSGNVTIEWTASILLASRR